MAGGSVKIPIIKLIIIGTYTSGGGGGGPNPEFPTIICWKFVESSTFQMYNFEFKCPYHRGEGGVEITLIWSL